MAVDYFLKIEGVKGESKDSKHKDEIDILAWSWGVSNPASQDLGGGMGGGKADFMEIGCTKLIDKSTPVFLKQAASGKHFPSGLLTARKSGGDAPVEYLKIKLKDVFVSSYSTGGSADGPIPTEQVGLMYKEIQFEYTPQKDDGTPEGSSIFGWNLNTNEFV